MSTLTLQKLKDLWELEQRDHSVVDTNSEIVKRAEQIFDSYDHLKKVYEPLKGVKWETVINPRQDRKDIIDKYESTAPKGGKEILGDLFKICPGLSDENRDTRFYLTSNTVNEDSESAKINEGMPSRVQSYFLSYNHPVEIARYLLAGENEIPAIPNGWDRGGKDGNTCQNRFPLKYLWMLRTTSVIPILSLQSFYNLEQVFLEIDPNFKKSFNFDGNDIWKQMINKDNDNDCFVKKWPIISGALSNALPQKTKEQEQAQFSAKRRQELATFLFYVSLADNVDRDALTMLEHGNRAIILYGPPGTGKTYRAKQIACQMIGIPFDPKKEPEYKINAETLAYSCTAQFPQDNGMYQVIQFHPNYSYQDFIGGIFPCTENGQIVYENKKGVFQILCNMAAAKANENKKFILIIDEINRANLSAVFGELMYCLEYRGEPIDIPLFGEFSIPANVFIIGTMNNTDKSLIGFDLALRRRFGFIKIMPDMRVLDTIRLDRPEVFRQRAEDLNKNLKEKLNLSEDKQIGHAYFMKIKDFLPEEKGNTEYSYKLTTYALEQLWDYHIAPLLEEYLGMEFESKKNAVESLKTDFTKAFQEA